MNIAETSTTSELSSLQFKRHCPKPSRRVGDPPLSSSIQALRLRHSLTHSRHLHWTPNAILVLTCRSTLTHNKDLMASPNEDVGHTFDEVNSEEPLVH